MLLISGLFHAVPILTALWYSLAAAKSSDVTGGSNYIWHVFLSLQQRHDVNGKHMQAAGVHYSLQGKPQTRLDPPMLMPGFLSKGPCEPLAGHFFSRQFWIR